MTLIRQRLVTKKNPEDEPFFKKIEELSLLLVRMTIQNNNFMENSLFDDASTT